MTKASNLTESESAARRRILFQFARTKPSSEVFRQFVSDMQLFMPLPDDLVVEARRELDQRQDDVNNNNASLSADDNPRRKKLRTEGPGLQIFEDDGSPSLHALYSGDLGEKVISYASVSDFCTLDILNKQFSTLTTKAWEKITYERFGMKNGKDGWRMGTSLLKEPVFIHIDRHPTYGDMYFAGSPQVTANDTMIAVDTDDKDEEYSPVGINLFDATDLTYLGSRRGGGWRTTVAGHDGNHLFISTGQNYIRFRRGNIRLRREFTSNRNPDGIPLIATETHVIFVIANNLHLLKIVSSNNLVESCQLKELQRGPQREDEYYNSAIAWGADQSEFVVYNSIKRIYKGTMISM